MSVIQNTKRVICVLTIGLLWQNLALSQNKVVVIPLGSDVSAEQFNALVERVNQSHIFNGFVDSDGSKGGTGHYISSRESEGVYTVNVFPSPEFKIKDYGQPSIVVTSKDVHRVAKISDVSTGAPISGNVSQLAFKVTLSALNGTLADAGFYFHVGFAEFSSSIDGPSDLRLKTRVKDIGKTSAGIKLYQFNYINDPSDTSYVGVMAQDLLTTHPAAVGKDTNGYYRVNYFKLGLRMSTLENWGKYGLGAVQLDYGGAH